MDRKERDIPGGTGLRVASLLPAATEIVCALGRGDALVGVSHECDFPAGVEALPRLTRTHVDPQARSRDIDAAVRDRLGRGLGVYDIDMEALRAAAPDVIVTQDQCDVCAVSLAEVEAAARATLGTDARIVSLRPAVLADVFADIARVGAALGAGQEAAALVAGLQARVDAVRLRALAARYRPRVVCIEWLEPLMVAGNWVPEIVASAGGRYEAVVAGRHSETWDADRLVAAAPEVVLVAPCGFGLGQTRSELAALTAQPFWRALPAVRNGRVYAIDGNAYLNRPGPRIVESLELVAGLIQPGLLAGRMPADGWFRIEG